MRVFSYNELLRGTENFSDSLLLGKGGFGIVYLAEWNGGIQMAVKKLLVEGRASCSSSVKKIAY